MTPTFIPAPKPDPRPIAPRSYSSIKPRTAAEIRESRRKLQAKQKPLPRVNRKRKATEFQRTYHSRERVAFVKSLPCFATGKIGQSDNAHVCDPFNDRGMGRKASYLGIAPLSREAHRLFDTHPARFTERYGDFDPAAMAAWTEQKWIEFSGVGVGE